MTRDPYGPGMAVYPPWRAAARPAAPPAQSHAEPPAGPAAWDRIPNTAETRTADQPRSQATPAVDTTAEQGEYAITAAAAHRATQAGVTIPPDWTITGPLPEAPPESYPPDAVPLPTRFITTSTPPRQPWWRRWLTRQEH